MVEEVEDEGAVVFEETGRDLVMQEEIGVHGEGRDDDVGWEGVGGLDGRQRVDGVVLVPLDPFVSDAVVLSIGEGVGPREIWLLVNPIVGQGMSPGKETAKGLAKKLSGKERTTPGSSTRSPCSGKGRSLEEGEEHFANLPCVEDVIVVAVSSKARYDS